jgi:S-DNA-T family DNA segregation ATPase FtsK/SpoIIIE
MARKARTPTFLNDDAGFSIKREAIGFFCLLAGTFFYLCLVSFDPLDPSFFTSSQAHVSNMGGRLGSYLMGTLVFLFGGATYFLGLYFVINAFLLFFNKRDRLKLIDFLVYLACAVFIAIFLQLKFATLGFSGYPLNAGGTIGKILGDIGATYLGKWGMYLCVTFGAFLTFVLATKLSLIGTVSASGVVLGRGLSAFTGRAVMHLTRFEKILFRAAKKSWERFSEWRRKRAEAAVPAAAPVVAIPEPKPIVERKPLPAVDIDRILKKPSGEPTILKRREIAAKPKPKQLELGDIDGDYRLPALDFLDHEDHKPVTVDEASLKMSAKILEKKLKDFAIDGQITEIHPGPVITMYEFQPAPGVRLSKINSLSDDLSLAMGGRPVRIVSPLPNKPAVGIEIANHERETVWLKDIIGDERFQSHSSKLAFALGKDIEGIPYVADLKKMPHLLVAGATGSGKSVGINSMICSILYKARPDEVRMIMIDPKMIELKIYEGIPHLLLPVVTEAKKANLALNWAVREMERRYQLLSDVNARDMAGYNKKIEAGEIKTGVPSDAALEKDDLVIHEGKLPYIVVIVDEFADLMMVSSKDVESSVCRLAQKARAAGIHVILATQRPSVDVITGVIKANFPSRIAFKVTSKHDSSTIMNSVGAEHLLGQGDMLFIPPGASLQTRLHGAFVTENEILKIVDFLKTQAKPVYNEEILTPVAGSGEGDAGGGEGLDEFYDQAVNEVAQTKRVSISSIQRRFRIGYNRAARIVEQMEFQGVVSSPNGQGQRQVLVEQ